MLPNNVWELRGPCPGNSGSGARAPGPSQGILAPPKCVRVVLGPGTPRLGRKPWAESENRARGPLLVFSKLVANPASNKHESVLGYTTYASCAVVGDSAEKATKLNCTHYTLQGFECNGDGDRT